MSNRRITRFARTQRSYRNASRRTEAANPGYARNKDGSLSRASGGRNYPYPAGGATRSLLTLHRRILGLEEAAARPEHNRDDEKREMLRAKTRDELRAICKAQNVKGYGKMSKADLVEAALR